MDEREELLCTCDAAQYGFGGRPFASAPASAATHNSNHYAIVRFLQTRLSDGEGCPRTEKVVGKRWVELADT